MKIVYITLLISSILFSQSLNSQIKKLENSSPKERVALMNDIKTQLILMNENDRMNTIHLLKARVSSKNSIDINHQQFYKNHSNLEQHTHKTNLHHDKENSK
jgi:hypothetical protein